MLGGLIFEFSNPFSSFQCPLLSWQCYRTVDRTRDVALRFALLLLAAVSSGMLYVLVIRTLRATQQTPRKVALVRAFVMIYVMWLAFFIPYDVFELYYLITGPLPNRNFYPVNSPDYMGLLVTGAQLNFSGRVKPLITTATLLGTLRFSYGFFNSVMLLVLVKLFREPFKKLCGGLEKCRKK